MSRENQLKIADFQKKLHDELPGILWTMPEVAQHHMTLFEIVMTFRDYLEDRKTIFERCRESIDSELRAQLVDMKPIDVTLDTLEAGPTAVIVRGTDDGSFQRIRDAVSRKGILPNGTRTPPDIIHSSLARYTEKVDMEDIRVVLGRYQLNLTQTVTKFEMVEIWRMPMDYKTLEVYPLPYPSA